MRVRTLVLLAGVLVVLSGLAYAGRDHRGTTNPVLSTVGPPSLAAQPLPGTSPQPATTAPSGAGQAPISSARRVSAEWVSRNAALSGISAPAVAAYGEAVLSAPASCHLGWTTLAGIGWVESEQGTIGGRTLDADGRPSSAIVGPALDGGDYPAIPATSSSTALHGDPRWDHAVGPMQFLPSTWETWGRDGDGDGVVDPQDIDDAAAAAAAYLCATGQNLTTGDGWAAGIFAYNHSGPYVRQVFDAANTYATRVD